MVRRLLRGFLNGIILIARHWRFWLTSALLGVGLSLGLVLSAPPLWVSEGYVLLRPLILREGHLLTTDELGANYALHLRDEDRVARVVEVLELEEEPEELLPHITTQARVDGILYLRVVQAEPARAERLTRALLNDFQQELERENRTREELDRLVVDLSRSSFARRLNTPWQIALGRGVSVGMVVGVALVLLGGWYGSHRITEPLEAEQLTGAPTLGAIPKARKFDS